MSQQSNIANDDCDCWSTKSRTCLWNNAINIAVDWKWSSYFCRNIITKLFASWQTVRPYYIDDDTGKKTTFCNSRPLHWEGRNSRIYAVRATKPAESNHCSKNLIGYMEDNVSRPSESYKRYLLTRRVCVDPHFVEGLSCYSCYCASYFSNTMFYLHVARRTCHEISLELTLREISYQKVQHS